MPDAQKRDKNAEPAEIYIQYVKYLPGKPDQTRPARLPPLPSSVAPIHRYDWRCELC